MPESELRFRVADGGDGAAIAAIYAPYVRDTIVSFETEAPDAAAMAARIATIGARHPWLVATAADRVVGYAYACEYRTRLAYRWSVDVAVYVAQDTRQRGVGRALYRRLFALLRELGFVNAYAGITLPNPASIGLHEAFGFVPVGVYTHVGYKCGIWPDVGWWQCAVRPPPPSPAEPRTLADLEPARLRALLDGAD
jgi:L-amino acid N-acyltransferase YncA